MVRSSYSSASYKRRGRGHTVDGPSSVKRFSLPNPNQLLTSLSKSLNSPSTNARMRIGSLEGTPSNKAFKVERAVSEIAVDHCINDGMKMTLG